MNEAHIRNCVGLFFLGPFLLWYSYQKGPPELARKVMFWSGVTVLSTSGLGYLNSRFGSSLGMGNLLEKPALSSKDFGKRDEAKPKKVSPAPLAPPPSPVTGFRPIIDVKGVAA